MVERIKKLLFPGLVLLGACASWDDDAARCRGIEDDAARRACIEQLLARDQAREDNDGIGPPHATRRQPDQTLIEIPVELSELPFCEPESFGGRPRGDQSPSPSFLALSAPGNSSVFQPPLQRAL